MKTEFPELTKACSSLPELLQPTGTVWVALSGGCDSTVLLHLMNQLRENQGNHFSLKAIHVNHNIHQDSKQWAEHCSQLCSKLQVPLEVAVLESCEVDDLVRSSGSLENAAREVRYKRFERVLHKDDLLLMAHHADDQVETFFYRLIRGSGLTGLASIPVRRPLGKGLVLRPLLQVFRKQLEAYAAHHDLAFINDPANVSMEHDRSFIRQQVFPMLRQRWPGFAKSWLRSSQLLRESDDLLEQLAAIDLSGRQSEKNWSLNLEGTASLGSARLRNMLRFWLRQACRETNWPEPDHVSLGRIEKEVIGAAPSAMPEVRWPKSKPLCEIRRYDGHLYLMAVLAPVPEDRTWDDQTQPLPLGEGLGYLILEPVTTQGFRLEPGQRIDIRFDVEGLRVRPPGEPARHFRKYCQQKRIPPWIRSRTPLVYRDGVLVTVGNSFIPADQLVESAQNLYRIHWHSEELD